MKAICLLLIALGLVGVLFAAQAERNEVLWWEEDFESSASGWTHYCEPANMWKSVTYYLPFGDIRQYWIMGDGIGYTDHQYLVLDTPERILTDSTAILNFDFSCSIQPTPGASPPYNGWDAFNVRLSQDGGTNWTTISGSPEYNISSSYAFGEDFGEGPGVPGWGGYVSQTATFDLTDYIGMNVMIRFAFASDASISSENYYVILDNIYFGGYNNYGLDDGLMIPRNLGPASEDIWHLATDITAPSPTHIMKCQNAAGTYNSFMRDYLVSPQIDLPDDGTIRADFMVRGGLADDGYADRLGWEICGSDGAWQTLSLLYDTPDEWEHMNLVIYDPDELNNVLNGYLGQTVRFRWYLQSDSDTPSGAGLLLDDFRIWHHIQLAPPETLVASVNGTNVILTWSAPVNGGNPDYPITNYRVLRDDAEIAIIQGSVLTYTETDVPVGFHTYCLYTMSGIYESEASNTAWAYVTGDTQAELAHDDGTAESWFSAGSSHQMAVQFHHQGAVIVRYAKVYVHTPGTQGIILRVLDNDGPEDSPGTLLGQSYLLPVNVYEGWITCRCLPESLSQTANSTLA